jgi:transcriptional regulator with XRE-family HTH domain
MISFGKKIGILRKDKGCSQTDLANQLDTCVSVIYRYEIIIMTARHREQMMIIPCDS